MITTREYINKKKFEKFFFFSFYNYTNNKAKILPRKYILLIKIFLDNFRFPQIFYLRKEFKKKTSLKRQEN